MSVCQIAQALPSQPHPAGTQMGLANRLHRKPTTYAGRDIMTELHFLWPLSGGLLIGLSAALYLLLAGRVAGISGLAATVVGLTNGGSWTPARTQAAGFAIGILLGTVAAMALIREPQIIITSSIGLLVAGGLLVGFGTRLGSGCTSGHGVCGLARLSPRSMAATGTFMVVAALTVFVARHLLGVAS
jgi:uncharacterized protein